MVERSNGFCWMVVLLVAAWAVCPVGPRPAGAGQDSLGIVMEALKSGDPDMVAVAIGLVRDISGEAATKALAAELPNLPPTGQVQLISALADRGDRLALPAIMKLTQSPDADVRITAYKAMGQLGDASSVMPLAEASAKATGAEQKAAAESLSRLRGEGVDEAILAGIGTAEAAVKAELIGAVGRRNIVSGVSTLMVAAQEPETKVQREAFRVLKVIAGQGDVAGLVQLLMGVKTGSVRSEAERTVAAVAKRTEDPNAQVSAVLAALPGVDGDLNRASLLNVLGKIGSNRGLDVLKKAISDESESIREAAIRALSEWPTGEPATELLKAAVVSENPTHKVLALRGYIQLLGLATDLPASWKVALYELGMELSPNVQEKKRVLSGLGSAASVEALAAIERYLNDAQVRTEAQAAAVRIASAIAAEHPEKARAVLQKIAATAELEIVRNQAQTALDVIDGKRPEVIPETLQ